MITNRRPQIILMSPPDISDRFGVILQIRERALFLLALMVTSGRAWEQQELGTLSGWGYHTVRDELQHLKAHGLIVRGGKRSPWVATSFGNELISGVDISNRPTEGRFDPVDISNRPTEGRFDPDDGETSAHRGRFEQDDGETSAHRGRFEHPQEVKGLRASKHATEEEVGDIPIDDKSNPSYREGERPQEGANRPPTEDVSPDSGELALLRKQRRLICELMAINGKKAQQIISDQELLPQFLLAHWYDCQELEAKKKCDDARLMAAYRGRRRYTPKPKSLDRAYDWLHLSGNVTCQACAEEFVIDFERGEDPLTLYYDCPECKAEMQPTAVEEIERHAGDNRYLSYLDPA